MAKFEEVDERDEEEEEDREDEEDPFSDIDFFKEEESEEPEDEDRFTYIRDRLRALAADFRGTMNTSNDAYNKSFIELFGMTGSETEYGLEGSIDTEFNHPALSDLMVAKYWRAFKERLKVIMLQNKNMKKKMMDYLSESNKMTKELMGLYLELEGKYEEAAKGEIDEKEVLKRYFGPIPKQREDTLKNMYSQCDDVHAYRQLLHPNKSTLAFNERMFIKALNSVLGKFREGETTSADETQTG